MLITQDNTYRLIKNKPVDVTQSVIRDKKFIIMWQPYIENVPYYIQQGYVPIEMAEGNISYVDHRILDHHNEYSNLPSACVSALPYYKTLGDRENPLKILVNHVDLDCVMTGIVLAGLLPKKLTTILAEEVGLYDTEPLLANTEEMMYSQQIQLWRANIGNNKYNAWSWLYGVTLFIDMVEHPIKYKNHIDLLQQQTIERQKVAVMDYNTNRNSYADDRIISIIPSRVPGFDIQFMRRSEYSATDINGWKHLVLLMYIEKTNTLTIACPNTTIANKLFGDGGLNNVFPYLPAVNGATWGGRNSIGGSPRRQRFNLDSLNYIIEIIKSKFII